MSAEPSSLPLTSEVLSWVKVNNWVMETICGRYLCRKYLPGDFLNEPADPRYQIYGPNRLTRGPPQDSFKRARVIAQADADWIRAQERRVLR